MKTLHSDYEVLEKIGQGSQGTTFKARHTPTGDLVAIKVMDFGSVSDWKDVELFEREAAALEKLSHPSIPRYIDTWTLEEDGSLQMCLAQQFIEGQNLRQELSKGGKWTGEQALDALEQLLKILVYLHDRVPPVIHRDIKPNNIIRRPDGTLTLVDFGAVQTQRYGTVGGSTVIGTPGYMPLEQMFGQAEPRSDLYALGITVGHMLTGIEPSKIPLTNNCPDFGSRLTPAQAHRTLPIIERLTQPSKEARFLSARAALTVLAAPKPLPHPIKPITTTPPTQPTAPHTRHSPPKDDFQPLFTPPAHWAEKLRNTARSKHAPTRIVPSTPQPLDPFDRLLSKATALPPKPFDLHTHPTVDACDRAHWFEPHQASIQKAKSAPHTKNGLTIVDRPQPTTLRIQEQALIDQGFTFVGRQSALYKTPFNLHNKAITRTVWTDPSRTIYAIHNDTFDHINFYVFTNDRTSIRLETSHNPLVMLSHDDARALNLTPTQKLTADSAPLLTNLTMDQVMLFRDLKWFRHRPKETPTHIAELTHPNHRDDDEKLAYVVTGLIGLCAILMPLLVISVVLAVIALAVLITTLLIWFTHQNHNSLYDPTLQAIEHEKAHGLLPIQPKDTAPSATAAPQTQPAPSLLRS